MTVPKTDTPQEKDTRDGRRTHATHIPVRTVLPHNEKKRFSEKNFIPNTYTTHTPFFFVFINR